ncbi:hypothetical protein [Streptomyces sp. NPDC059753]
MTREAGLPRRVDQGHSRTAVPRRADLDQRFPGLLDRVRSEA